MTTYSGEVLILGVFTFFMEPFLALNTLPFSLSVRGILQDQYNFTWTIGTLMLTVPPDACKCAVNGDSWPPIPVIKRGPTTVQVTVYGSCRSWREGTVQIWYHEICEHICKLFLFGTDKIQSSLFVVTLQKCTCRTKRHWGHPMCCPKVTRSLIANCMGTRKEIWPYSNAQRNNCTN